MTSLISNFLIGNRPIGQDMISLHVGSRPIGRKSSLSIVREGTALEILPIGSRPMG